LRQLYCIGMRSPVEFCLYQTDSYSNMIAKIQQILEKPLSFAFEFYEVVDQFSNENGEEDWLVRFPDITSTEPVLWGETILVYNNNQKAIADPSWKHILDFINNTTDLHSNVLFKDLEIIGLTEDGMGYVVEVVFK
jgi:hypothetical protein